MLGGRVVAGHGRRHRPRASDRARARALRREGGDRGRRAEVLEEAAAEVARSRAGGRRRGRLDRRRRARARAGRAADRDAARAPRAPGRARQQRRRAVLQPGRADRGEGLAGGVAAERGGHAQHVRGGLRAGSRAGRARGRSSTSRSLPTTACPGWPTRARRGRRSRRSRASWPGAGRRRASTVTAVAAGHFDTEVLAKYPASVRAGASRTVPLAAPGHRGRARLAGGAARLAARPGLQRLDRHARRRARQLVRPMAAARAWPTRRARCPWRSAGRRGRGAAGHAGRHGGSAAGRASGPAAGARR